MTAEVSAATAASSRGTGLGLPSTPFSLPHISSSRMRHKKLSFKQKICVQKGSVLNGAANALVNGIAPEFEATEQQQDSTFGVDSHEITEHHLQAALSSHQVEATSAGDTTQKKSYHIPTPKTVEVLTAAKYNEEYPPNAYSDPVTYVRFSDTVEGSISGAPYCLDEDDQGWLDKHNNRARKNLEDALTQMKDTALSETQKTKALAEKDPNQYRLLSEDEFETVMYVFESATSERHPLLELDISKLPKLEDLLCEFDEDSAAAKLALPELPPLHLEAQVSESDGNAKAGKGKKTSTTADEEGVWSPANPFRFLSQLKPCAHVVYPWWKLRREAREGKAIVPFLNFDESNDNDPYVCFRRREVKSARKTRKTDTQQLERLVRLESELQQATQLMLMLAQRERLKEAQVTQSHECWLQAQEILALKRRWNISGPNRGQDDEGLLFSIQSDPRSPVPSAAAAAAAATAALQNTSTMKKKRKVDEAAASSTLKLRRPKAGDTEPLVNKSAEPVASAASRSAILERIQAVQSYVERECRLRAQADAAVEDLTDSGFQPSMAPPSLRAFRPIQSDNNDTQFWTNHPFARLGRQSCFRRRVGRGGRVHLDRRPLAASPAPANVGAWPRPRQHGFPLATFGYERTAEGTRRSEWSARSTGGEAARPMATSMLPTRVAPMLLPTPDLTWDPLRSKDERAPLTHDPSFFFGHGVSLSDSPPAPVSSQSDMASVASDSSERTHASELSDGQSTQATDVEQEGMHEDKLDATWSAAQEESLEEQMERAQRLAERWRYDEDGGRWAGLGLLGLGGMEGDEEAVLDDYDQRFVRYRLSLLDESNLLKLSTDWTHMRQALLAAAAPSPTPLPITAAETAKPASTTDRAKSALTPTAKSNGGASTARSAAKAKPQPTP